ncbi:MAG TPA: bifunctional diguanylate cyclase/phosphodiesterase [Acidocella sp.]|nr:MAG: hypothetical protein B7Z71_09730 [Acidocella sp. 21-58-7]HQT65150.1 bifunctional diguanylate cyclase/phosphodiesterase [Acidocella sp.]HQU03568.1 bifunctional diguanylate cyclase/phosphodiesterase [Acidocella sp.]
MIEPVLILVCGCLACWGLWRAQAAAHRAVLARLQADHWQWSQSMADAMFDAVLIHRQGEVLAMNRALQHLLGCAASDWVGRNFSSAAVSTQATALRAELTAPGPVLVEFTLIDVNEAEHLVEMRSQVMLHEGRPATITAMRDVTAARAAAAQMHKLLNQDRLTGLANRVLFMQRLAAALETAEADRTKIALLCLDIDQLKAVNLQLGRARGDVLLRQLAERLTALVRGCDAVGRLSGDKFGIIQNRVNAVGQAMNLAARLEASLARPFLVDGQMVKISLSVGVALYPDHAAAAEDLMQACNRALKQAAASGGGCSRLFDPVSARDPLQIMVPFTAPFVLRPGLSEPQRLTQDLRGALARGEVSVEYQPVFRAGDLSLAGFEALARWHHEHEGWIAPSVFIPLAEQAGLIEEIGSFVLAQACKRAAAHGGDVVMAVNISPVQLRNQNFAKQVASLLQRAGLPPARLELEVTETFLIEQEDVARNALAALRDIGVGLALDDFGTGYSSLSYLCDFPFSRLKIDKRFVQAAGRDESAKTIICAIVSLAKNLCLQVTAEGVETPGQLQFLQAQGCQLLQGFLLGRPSKHMRVALDPSLLALT